MTPLHVRSIKQDLNLDHMRCKTPKMIHIEFRTTLLPYNLIPSVSAAAASLHDKKPRQISFVSACQYVMTSWISLLWDRSQPINSKPTAERYSGKSQPAKSATAPDASNQESSRRDPSPTSSCKNPETYSEHNYESPARKTCYISTVPFVPDTVNEYHL